MPSPTKAKPSPKKVSAKKPSPKKASSTKSSATKSRSTRAQRSDVASKPSKASSPNAATRGAALKKRNARASAASQAVKLLSGGNPQIAKADGDAPVQAYVAALPGWKRDLGRRLDQLVTRSVPAVQKAVKWNSPFYSADGGSWFLSFHAFTKYLKLTFFRGASLTPMPPGASKNPEVRCLDIRESDPVDEEQLRSWFQQAAAVPGWKP